VDISGAIFASRCKDVDKGNPAWARSVVLGSRGARKDTMYHVFDFGAFGVAHSAGAIVACSWIKIIEESISRYWSAF